MEKTINKLDFHPFDLERAKVYNEIVTKENGNQAHSRNVVELTPEQWEVAQSLGATHCYMNGDTICFAKYVGGRIYTALQDNSCPSIPFEIKEFSRWPDVYIYVKTDHNTTIQQ